MASILTTGIVAAGLAGGVERQREATEWSITYAFNANDTKLPRVLLIGDSICNGYQSFVKDELKDVAYISFFATSKCATDRSYLKELTHILEEYDYAAIHLNNGLHSLTTDRPTWEAALREVVKTLKAKGKGAKLVWATSTPLKDPALTAKARELNAIAARVMQENGVPADDLYGLMDPQDRALWSDTFHFHEAARKQQGKQVADCLRKLLPPPAPVTAPGK